MHVLTARMHVMPRSLLPAWTLCLATRMECTSLLPVCTSCLATRMQCLRPFIFKILGFARDDHFPFGSVFIKKVTKLKLFFKKPKPGQTDRFWFGSVWFFREKPGSNRFGSVFPVLARFSWFWLGFFGFGSVFLTTRFHSFTDGPIPSVCD